MASINKSDNEYVDLVYTIRNKRVMLDQDLAKMYEVETRILNQQVKRNIKKFPETFRFQLTKEEFKDFKENLTSQNVISSWGGRRYAPYAFTEKGVLMLANVLPSKKAAKFSIHIVETFVMERIRKIIAKGLENKEPGIYSKYGWMKSKWNKTIKKYTAAEELEKMKMNGATELYSYFTDVKPIVTSM